MSQSIRKESDGSITLSINIKLEGSMLSMEDKIQEAVNQLGLQATLSALEKFDTDGGPIQVNGQKLTSKGRAKKKSIPPTDVNQ